MDFQQTIRTPVSMAGIGLHSGVPVRMTLLPAAADTGILFRAADGTLIPAAPDHVVDTRSATTVGAFGAKVRTIEHLMAAVSALGIDNLLVEVDAEEIPAADGSAKPFVDLLYSAGRASLAAPRQPLAITEPIRVGDESRWLQILPSDTPAHQLHARQSPSGHRASGGLAGSDRGELRRGGRRGPHLRLPERRAHDASERPGSRRISRQCDRGRQAHRPQRQPAIRRRVRPAQGPRSGGGPGRARTPGAGARHRAQCGARAQPSARRRDPGGVRGRAPARRRARVQRGSRRSRRPAQGLLTGVAASDRKELALASGTAVAP